MPPPPEPSVENEQERKCREPQKVRAHWGPELYELAQVANQDWYMGLIGRNDIVPYLQKVGDYAVRAADKLTLCEFVLVVRSTAQVHHLTLTCDPVSKGWTLTPQKLGTTDCHTFRTICELIDFYKTNDLPLSPRVRLVQHCKRPKWMLKRSTLAFDVNKLLGSGAFCNVYAGKLNKRRTVAIKACRASEKENKTPQDNEDEIDTRDALIKEGQLMSTIHHKNNINFYGIYLDKPPVMIVMELCPGGSLQVHLQKFKDKITIGERLKFAQEIAEGMAYLHEKSLVHRDLAARNCLISKFGVCKVADFGRTKLVSELANEPKTKEKIPLRWMAPECLSKKPQYSFKSDVWAYGVLLYEIFNNGEKPWPDWEAKKISHYIRHDMMVDMPSKAPDSIRKLVKTRCWAFDVDKRCDLPCIIDSLSKIVPSFPCPKAHELTVNETPGVQALPPEKIQPLLDAASDENIVTDTASSNVTGDVNEQFKKISAAVTHPVEREVTIEEPPPSDCQTMGQQPPRRTPSRRQTSTCRNTGTKQQSKGCSRGSQELTSGSEDKSQQPTTKKSYKKMRPKATVSTDLTSTSAEQTRETPTAAAQAAAGTTLQTVQKNRSKTSAKK